MIILTATEWNFVIEQTGISGHVEQFSFLHLSLQTYSDDWEDVRVAGNERGERLLEVSGLTLSAAQTDFHQWKAVQDRRAGSDSWGGRDDCWTVPPVKKPVLILDFSHPYSCPKNFWAKILSPDDHSLRRLFSRGSHFSEFPLCSTKSPGGSHFQQWELRVLTC